MHPQKIATFHFIKQKGAVFPTPDARAAARKKQAAESRNGAVGDD
eukprot:COSAG06_NODE_60438_length_274_cov_0.523256_1_plen_44_part_10